MGFIEKLDKLFGDPSVKYIKQIKPQVAAINALEEEFNILMDHKNASDKETKANDGPSTTTGSSMSNIDTREEVL